MNLFISFAFNNALWLIWYRFIVANTDLLLNNGVRIKNINIIEDYGKKYIYKDVKIKNYVLFIFQDVY